MKKYMFVAFCFVLFGYTFYSLSFTSSAREKNIQGYLYEFEDNGKYNISDADNISSIQEETILGSFYLDGNITEEDNDGSVTYYVEDGNVEFRYSLNEVFIESEKERYVCVDKKKKVNGEILKKKIGTGSIIVQSSIDGIKWITDYTYTDIGSEESGFDGMICFSNDIQQINGCYYRIIVAYKTNQKNGKKDNIKKYAEVYEFYLKNSEANNANFALPETTPKKELGVLSRKKNNKGYYLDREITVNDPHYGWKIGTFYINGYTRETTEGIDVTPVFLKNVGDRVTLWFNLKQDISSLNGNEKLQVVEDKNGYDQNFQIPKTNFEHGTLIIQYTDYQGVKHDPVIYTDFLAANARTGADTKVELFEEGDYEVVLDYEIKDKSSLFGKKADYQIKFKFCVRNGNCMVYPFDAETGSELSDGAITESGFELDMARSRYLNIDVKRTVLINGSTGMVEDVRFNRPAKDGDSYTDEGIYTFNVKNLYTGENTTKVIYVGDDKFLRAMSKNELTVKQIETELENGATIGDDGTIYSARSNLDDELIKPVVIYKEETEKSELPVVIPEEKTVIVQEMMQNSTNLFFDGLERLLNNNKFIVLMIALLAFPYIFMFLMLIQMSKLKRNTKRIAKAIEKQQKGEEKNE